MKSLGNYERNSQNFQACSPTSGTFTVRDMTRVMDKNNNIFMVSFTIK